MNLNLQDHVIFREDGMNVYARIHYSIWFGYQILGFFCNFFYTLLSPFILASENK